MRDLIEYALSRRPDLAARTAGVALANVRHNQELARPWLPTVWLGYSAGGFGGGSNVIPPTLAHFGGRSDFDVRLFWTISNIGIGNLSLQQRRLAQLNEAEAQRVGTINRVRQEVTSARADALAARAEIDIARSELASAENGFREDLERSRQNLGRPIEVLNSLNLLGGARVNLIRALLRYDQAQFRLFVALGSPPPLLTPPQEGTATAPRDHAAPRRRSRPRGIRWPSGRGEVLCDQKKSWNRTQNRSRVGPKWFGPMTTGLPNSECCQSM